MEHPYRDIDVETNGIRLHTVQAGDPANPPVILLHGFPEFWYGWRHQIPALAAAGLHVIAPDLRGYNLSDKPRRIRDYRLDTLAQDIVDLFDALGKRPAYLIGHDWGGIIAWWIADHAPERITKLAVLNAPHVGVFRRYLLTHPGQWLRSAYVLPFQIPGLIELPSRWFHWPIGPKMLKASSPRAFTRDDLKAYEEAWDQPRALRSGLNYYRAALWMPPKADPAHPKIVLPTLILWGRRDLALSTGLAFASAKRCENAQVVILNDATHWTQHEAPGRVNNLLVDFLSA